MTSFKKHRHQTSIMPNVAAIIVKLMPESPNIDLKQIEADAKIAMESHGAKNISFEERPVAFGLKSIHMKLAIDESKGTDLVESELAKIAHVSSVTIEDYRRAFG
jgi:elongation factor 1-beta